MKSIKNPLTRISLVLMVLAAASIACNLPAGGSNQPLELPPTAQPLNPEEMRLLEEQMKATLQGTTNGEVTITITQSQLNAYISTEIASQPNAWITEPSVVLTSGQMEVYGKIAQGGLSANAKITLKPHVDASGTPGLDILSIDVGSVPMPDAFNERVATLIDDTFGNYLAQSSSSFKVNQISITEGQMTVSGVRQQP